MHFCLLNTPEIKKVFTEENKEVFNVFVLHFTQVTIISLTQQLDIAIFYYKSIIRICHDNFLYNIAGHKLSKPAHDTLRVKEQEGADPSKVEVLASHIIVKFN